MPRSKHELHLHLPEPVCELLTHRQLFVGNHPTRKAQI
ncbi:MAG: hypothetical protein QOK44_1967 [Betaproteobacteria bacterium]|nr:hypothetical protein [Betaproteobacteria bacterium]